MAPPPAYHDIRTGMENPVVPDPTRTLHVSGRVVVVVGDNQHEIPAALAEALWVQEAR
jgi:hypothetical protein